jgi:hypothetical protein
MEEARKRMIPKEGFNLVGIDTLEIEPGAELFLVDNFASREEAEAKKAVLEAEEGTSNEYVIYDNRGC